MSLSDVRNIWKRIGEQLARVADFNPHAEQAIEDLLNLVEHLVADQEALDDAEPFTLGFSRTPPPTEITTDVAATADGGLLDAALVKVFDATIGATATVAGDFILTVDDGTGTLEVVLDQSLPFSLVPFTVGADVDVTGVLVPTGSGTWQLKPTSPGDILIK